MYHNNFVKRRISAVVQYKLFQKKDERMRYTISGLHERKGTSSQALTSCAFSLRHPDKDSHRFCDNMSVLDVEEQLQCFAR